MTNRNVHEDAAAELTAFVISWGKKHRLDMAEVYGLVFVSLKTIEALALSNMKKKGV